MKLCVVLCVFGLLAAFTTGCDKPKTDFVKAVAVEQQAYTQDVKVAVKEEKKEVKEEVKQAPAKTEKAKSTKKKVKAEKAKEAKAEPAGAAKK